MYHKWIGSLEPRQIISVKHQTLCVYVHTDAVLIMSIDNFVHFQ